MPTKKILGSLAVLTFLCVASTAGAQSEKRTAEESSDASATHPAQFSSGLTAGAMSFTGGRAEQALTLLLQFRPVPWLAVSASPGFGRTTLGSLSSNGFTDVPITSAAQYSATTAPWSPVFFGSLSAVLSPGSSGTPLGIGRTAAALGGGLSISPVASTYVSAAASRPVTAASGNGSVNFSISRVVGRATNSVGYSTEIGSADSSATLSRSIAGGVTFLIRDPVSVAFDGSHGLTPGSPKWTFSVGVGTAFSGMSSIAGGSLFGRLKNAFGSRATSSSGYSKTSSGSTSCRELGTC